MQGSAHDSRNRDLADSIFGGQLLLCHTTTVIATVDRACCLQRDADRTPFLTSVLRIAVVGGQEQMPVSAVGLSSHDVDAFIAVIPQAERCVADVADDITFDGHHTTGETPRGLMCEGVPTFPSDVAVADAILGAGPHPTVAVFGAVLGDRAALVDLGPDPITQRDGCFARTVAILGTEFPATFSDGAGLFQEDGGADLTGTFNAGALRDSVAHLTAVEASRFRLLGTDRSTAHAAGSTVDSGIIGEHLDPPDRGVMPPVVCSNAGASSRQFYQTQEGN